MKQIKNLYYDSNQYLNLKTIQCINIKQYIYLDLSFLMNCTLGLIVHTVYFYLCSVQEWTLKHHIPSPPPPHHLHNKDTGLQLMTTREGILHKIDTQLQLRTEQSTMLQNLQRSMLWQQGQQLVTEYQREQPHKYRKQYQQQVQGCNLLFHLGQT